MGVVNVTPDSFSDGGRFADHRGRDRPRTCALRRAGADWVDVGGESTRPGAAPVSEAEELRRVLPVVEALAEDGLRVSIDTRKAAVARAAVAAGATLLNDVGAIARRGGRRPRRGVGRHARPGRARHDAGRPRLRTTSSREVRDLLVDRADAARSPLASPRCGSTRASASARRTRTTSRCSPTSTSSSPPGTPCSSARVARGSSARCSAAPTARRADPRRRPPRGLARHRHLGHGLRGADGARPRRAGHRAGGSGHRGTHRQGRGRMSAAASRRSRGSRSRGIEGQVGPGDPAAELRVDPQGQAGRVRATRRLRRQPPPGAPPGGDHLDPGAGLHAASSR